MIKLLIKKIDSYIYELVDEGKKVYKLNLEFINLNEKPLIGDYIIMDKNILNENNFYTFGPLKEAYKEQKDLNVDKDFSVLIHGDTKIYLQRYYG
jgi:glyoxylate utilization-related uncharacterized protein